MRASLSLSKNRQGVYYFNYALPTEHHTSLGKKQLRKSLRTKSRKQAISKAKYLYGQLDEILKSDSEDNQSKIALLFKKKSSHSKRSIKPETLQLLPPHLTKKPNLRNKTIAELLEMKSEKTLSPVTIGKHISRLRGLVSY